MLRLPARRCSPCPRRRVASPLATAPPRAQLALGIVFYGFQRYQKQLDWPTADEHNSTSPFLSALYFCIVTTSSVGYGDLHPSAGNQLFTTCYALLGICTFGVLAEALARLGTSLVRVFVRFFIPDRVAFLWNPPSTIQNSCSYVAAYTFFLALHLGSAFIFQHIEDWTFQQSFYHCIITATTIGYGDVTITTETGRFFACIHILLSVVFFTYVIKLIKELGQQAREEEHRRETFADPDLIKKILEVRYVAVTLLFRCCHVTVTLLLRLCRVITGRQR